MNGQTDLVHIGWLRWGALAAGVVAWIAVSCRSPTA